MSSGLPSSESTAPVAPGDVLAGKYRVERVLGVGGMGVVVAARHLQLDERVALKFLLPDIAAKGGEPVARFAREGRAAAKIRSEHVARVTDVGTLETGSPYLVMEYLDGRDLSQVLEETGPLSFDDALDYVLQASEAIAEAHSQGIVHRDLKPANLFLTRRADGSPCVKVLDFGISKMKDPQVAASDMTRTRAVIGSPVYMSPEQLTSSRDADARSDIWSLGIILYELCTGEIPFTGDTMPQLVAQVLQRPARPIRELRADAPPALEAAIVRCLQKEPTMRFPNIGALATALSPSAPRRCRVSIQRIERIFGSQSDGSEPPPPAPRSPEASGPAISPVAMTAFARTEAAITDPTAGPVTATPVARSRRMLLAVGAVLVLALVAGALVLRSRPAQIPADTASSAALAPPPSSTSTSTSTSTPTSTPTPTPTPTEPTVALSLTATVPHPPPAVPRANASPKPKAKPTMAGVPDDR